MFTSMITSLKTVQKQVLSIDLGKILKPNIEKQNFLIIHIEHIIFFKF